MRRTAHEQPLWRGCRASLLRHQPVWSAVVLPILAGLMSGAVACASAAAQVVFSEIMYHPVEEPAFNADGSPVLDLYEDVHEFVELYNLSGNEVSLAGWEITGGISYRFPAHAAIGAGRYRVVAKDPSRLAALPAYGLNVEELYGPYQGQLGNRRDTLRLRDAAGAIVESVAYSAEFPWAISADALGADDDFTGLKAAASQYRGRSLERVSFAHSANDPANWLASPLPGEPSPGRTNSVSLAAPRPVVTSLSVTQASDESAIIRSNQPVLIRCGFSATNSLAAAQVEWFVDSIDLTNETHTTTAMTSEGPPELGRFVATIPGQTNRAIVRYRFWANRGAGDEVVSPRADDPYLWHAYFITPARSSSRPIYDLFISKKSLNTLSTNISQSPRRVTSPDPPGKPRASWNASEPGVVVFDNVVYDMRAHYHGSRYNRNPGNNSWQWRFPRYRKFNGATALMVTDKGDDTVCGRGLFRALELPVSEVRWVDLYVNNGSATPRLEQGEFDGPMLDQFHRRQQALNPGAELEPTGDIRKDVGTIEEQGEGPYGRGDARKLSKLPNWTDLQMYEWTYPLQNHEWRGYRPFKQMLDAFWQARGDTVSRPNPNLPALRTFFTNYFDINEMLNYIALENWCCPWDDTTQNHFLWQRRNGHWGLLPWDMDAWFGRGDNTPATSSLFIGEVGDPNNNFRGPNFIKDGFIKAFRQELKERFFLLNHTLLHPDNLRAMGYSSILGFAETRFATVNQKCGLGVFQRPQKPVAVSPRGGAPALPPMVLRASDYTHTTNPAPAHLKTMWELRADSRTYEAPVWKLITSTNLTSVPIPFTRLEFGQSYFWRCTYYDASGHPSLVSDEAGFRFGPAPVDRTLIAIDGAARWKYDQSGFDFSQTNWTAAAFNDSAWLDGPALLGKDDAALPEPIRTPLRSDRITHYFRTHFDYPGDPRGAKLRFRLIVDDGCFVYLNGERAFRLRMDDVPPTYSTIANENITVHVYEGPFDLPATNLLRGDNLLAVEVHQTSASSSDVLFGLSLEASMPAVSGDLVLNEIAARNTGSITTAAPSPDWLELFNNGSTTIDLGGMSLSDDVLEPNRFLFPTNVLIPPQGYLVVWCDDATNLAGLHTGFALSGEGGTVTLCAPTADGPSVRDYVTYGLQADDLTVGRVPNGKGPWQLTRPTPGAANELQPSAPPADLKINEWMAAPDSGADWFELYNPASLPVALGGLHLTDNFQNPTNTRIADLSFIGARGFVRFVADEDLDQGPEHVDFKLSAAGDSIGLYAADGLGRIDAVTFGRQFSSVSQGRLPDGAAKVAFFPATASPGDSNYLPLDKVVLNEVLAHTDPPLEDAIELQNLSALPVDVSGWWLSDSRAKPCKFPIPPGTVLAPGGFAVFYEFEFNADTNSPASFALNSAHGDRIALSEADVAGALTGYCAEVEIGATENGVSLGRVPTSQGWDFATLAQRTFGVDSPLSLEEFRQGKGCANSPPRVGPLVVSEIMFHPPALGTNDNRRDEFIELCNITAEPVPLFAPQWPTNSWRLRKAVEFEFPEGVLVPPGGCVVLVSFDPATNTAALVEFQGVYGNQPVRELVYGPFRGKLGNTDDTIELSKPDAPLAFPPQEAGFVPYILAEKISYLGRSPWPDGAAGTGLSLHRLDLASYGNEPLNWKAATPTPGRAPAPNVAWRLAAVPDLAGGLLRIRATGPGQGTAILQRSSDLVSGVWTKVQTKDAAGGAIEFIEPLDQRNAARWYRVILEKPMAGRF